MCYEEIEIAKNEIRGGAKKKIVGSLVLIVSILVLCISAYAASMWHSNYLLAIYQDINDMQNISLVCGNAGVDLFMNDIYVGYVGDTPVERGTVFETGMYASYLYSRPMNASASSLNKTTIPFSATGSAGQKWRDLFGSERPSIDYVNFNSITGQVKYKVNWTDYENSKILFATLDSVGDSTERCNVVDYCWVHNYVYRIRYGVSTDASLTTLSGDWINMSGSYSGIGSERRVLGSDAYRTYDNYKLNYDLEFNVSRLSQTQYIYLEVEYANGTVELLKQEVVFPVSIITYNANGGTGTMSSDTKINGVNYTIRDSSFTAPSGKVFIGWNTSADGTGVSYNVGQIYTTDENLNLYAMYLTSLNDTDVLVNYYGNGATSGSNYYNSYFKTAYANSISPFSKTGYLFSHWNTKSDNTGTSISESELICENVQKTTISTYVNSNRVLDLAGGSIALGTNVQLWDKLNNDAQKFSLKYERNIDGINYWSIINSYSGRALDVQDGNSNWGTNVRLWDYNGYASQLWTFKQAGNGYFYIVSALRDSSGGEIALDVPDGNSYAGQNIRIWQFNGSNAQKFYFDNAEFNLYAQWTPKSVKTIFNRNQNSSDTNTYSEIYTYDVSNQSFGMNLSYKPNDFGTWSKTGYHLLGWSENRTATSQTYTIYSGVSNEWINNKYGNDVNLYGV